MNHPGPHSLQPSHTARRAWAVLVCLLCLVGCTGEDPLVDIDSTDMTARLWQQDIALLGELNVYPPRDVAWPTGGPFIDAARGAFPELVHPVVRRGLADPERAVPLAVGLVSPLVAHTDWTDTVAWALTRVAAIEPSEPRTTDSLREADARLLGKKLERLPVELRGAVLDIALAMLDCRLACREALAELTPHQLRLLRENGLPFVEGTLVPEHARQVLPLLQKVDLGPMARATMKLATQCARFHQRAQIFLMTDAARTLDVTLDTPIGRIVVTGTGDDVHGDAALVIDLGGNDTYRRPVGSNTWSGGAVAVALDLSGNDTWQAPGNFAVASGYLGIGLVVDWSGEDTWGTDAGDNRGGLGFGMAGIGVLVDLDGNDRYTASTTSQGAGCRGLGLLLDGRGDDIYTGRLLCQAVGFAGGAGVLAERLGNDRYRCGIARSVSGASGPSWAQGVAVGHPRIERAPAGVGLLADLAGDDHLEADGGAQGAASGAGLGMLVNLRGHDRTDAGSHAQAYAENYGIALLVDTSGDDHYRVGRLGLAAADGPGVAVLMENQGWDRYRGSDRTRGWSLSPNTFVLMVDHEGNDRHRITTDTEPSLARANLPFPRRSFRALLDWSGRDTYTGGLTVETADGLAVNPSRSPWHNNHVDVHTAGCLALDVSHNVWLRLGLRPVTDTTPRAPDDNTDERSGDDGRDGTESATDDENALPPRPPER